MHVHDELVSLRFYHGLDLAAAIDPTVVARLEWRAHLVALCGRAVLLGPR